MCKMDDKRKIYPGSHCAAMNCSNNRRNNPDLEGNGLYYVAGFLLRKLFKWHSCEVCKALWIDRSCASSNGNSVYTACRLYSASEIKNGAGLVTVSDAFFEYITHCESLFTSLFDLHGHEPGILHLIVDRLVNCPPPVICEDFPKVTFLRYFVRMRIMYRLKFFNRSHSASKVDSKKKPRKNRKLAKLQHV